jgi:hypothetical protein
MPAQAGIHILLFFADAKGNTWIPGFAGYDGKTERRKKKLHRANAFSRFSAAFPDFSTAPLRFQSDAGTVSASR